MHTNKKNLQCSLATCLFLECQSSVILLLHKSLEPVYWGSKNRHVKGAKKEKETS